MALTPEQVLNKHFQTTQFRRGYEERDVDDFLDEIVAEMRSLIEQRDDYLKQLNDCRASRNQPAVRAGDTGGASPSRSDDEKPASGSARLEDTERAVKAASDRAAQAGVDADEAEKQAQERIERATAQTDVAQQSASSATVGHDLDEAQARLDSLNEKIAEAQATLADTEQAPSSQPGSDPGTVTAPVDAEHLAGAVTLDAAGVIALAQRLHDEHVAAGEAQRDALITEAQARHASLISEAQQRHAELLSTGQAKYDELTEAGRAQHDEAVREAEELAARATTERDEMIAAATAQRDQMTAEATRSRDEMLTAARERSTVMVAEAQQRKAAVLEQLEKDKSLLERTIDELRGFERSYRGNLRVFIEGQLHELEGNPQEPVAQATGTGHEHEAPDSI